MYQNTKSATTAGLLGIFLGAFGAHNWYLGEKGKGIAHVCMMGGGVLVEIIAGAVLPNVLSFSALLTWASILGVLASVAALAMSASGLWGLIEGITILAQGDAGLARKGYDVAAPVAPTAPQGYPMQGQYGYGPQPMPMQQQMQPMQQPYYGPQPMQPMQNQPMPMQSNQDMSMNQSAQGQPMPTDNTNNADGANVQQ